LRNLLRWGGRKESRNDLAPYRWENCYRSPVDRLGLLKRTQSVEPVGALRQSVEQNESPERAEPHEFPLFL
jgi:hypothetical protein